MFLRMIRGVLMRQRGKMLMIAFTIALGASLASTNDDGTYTADDGATYADSNMTAKIKNNDFFIFLKI